MGLTYCGTKPRYFQQAMWATSLGMLTNYLHHVQGSGWSFLHSAPSNYKHVCLNIPLVGCFLVVMFLIDYCFIVDNFCWIISVLYEILQKYFRVDHSSKELNYYRTNTLHICLILLFFRVQICFCPILSAYNPPL